MKSFLFKEFCLLRECGEIVLSEGKKIFFFLKYEKKLSLDISLIFTLEFEKCIFFLKRKCTFKIVAGSLTFYYYEAGRVQKYLIPRPELTLDFLQNTHYFLVIGNVRDSILTAIFKCQNHTKL